MNLLQDQSTTPASTSHPPRIKHACEPCKKRKRRCNGEQPCATCIKYDYICNFEPVPKRIRSRQPDGAQTSPQATSPAALDVRAVNPGKDALFTSHTSPREANSGAAFAQLLRKRLEPRNVSSPGARPQNWNIDMSDEPRQLKSELTRIITKEQMFGLSAAYFSTIHQLYGFLNRAAFESKVEERWQTMYEPDSCDAILSGVAALGSQFLGDSSKSLEVALVDCAKRVLEVTSASNTPSYENATSWTLRTIYLRSTTQPYAAWITSCTAMLTIDGLIVAGVSDDDVDDGLINRQRLFWCATVLNTWVSNEYGRSKVEIANPLPSNLDPRPGDFTHDLLFLYKISERLDPKKPSTAVDFETGLAELVTFSPPVDALALSQSNLGLTLYRRLRFVASTISDETISRVISLGNSGLDAVIRLIRFRQPWWHVANVPFQYICTLLVIDTEEALENLPRAMDTLQAVAQCFPTRSLTETLSSVRKLIHLSCKQKRGQLSLLERSLAPRPAPFEPETPRPESGVSLAPPMATEWSPASMDGLDFADFDWEKFFSTDISVLEYPVPMP